MMPYCLLGLLAFFVPALLVWTLIYAGIAKYREGGE
jgi:hypothetical protein